MSYSFHYFSVSVSMLNQSSCIYIFFSRQYNNITIISLTIYFICFFCFRFSSTVYFIVLSSSILIKRLIINFMLTFILIHDIYTLFLSNFFLYLPSSSLLICVLQLPLFFFRCLSIKPILLYI